DSKNIICTMDTNVIKEVFVTKSKHFIRLPIFDVLSIQQFGATNLFAANGDDWHKHRTLMDPGFSDDNLKYLFEENVKSTANRLYQKWKKFVDQSENGKAEINITPDCGALTLDLIAEAGFGIYIKSIEGDNRVTTLIAKLFEQTHLGVNV